MTSNTATRNPWRERDADLPALTRVRRFVRSATWARRRQLITSYALAGLFVSLLLASVAIIAARMGWLALPPLSLALAIPGVGVLVAVLFAIRNFPNELSVAIEADLKLNLRQRLSTAFEFAYLHRNFVDAERLAAHAVRARLPARPQLTFPLQLNTWGRLVPVAVLSLGFAALIDVELSAPTQDVVADALVVEHGQRLRDYGQRLERDARAQELAKSLEAARDLERLGARMQSGTLSRSTALSRLQDLERQFESDRDRALMSGPNTPIGPIDVRDVPQPGDRLSRLNELLRRLAQGTATTEEMSQWANDAKSLLELGADPLAFEQAQRDLRDGDERSFRTLIEQLANAERGRSEVRHLEHARSTIHRTRRELGDTEANSNPMSEQQMSRRFDGADDPSQGGSSVESEMADEFASEDSGLSAPGRGPGGESNRQSAPVRDSAPSAAAMLRPQSQFGDGGVFSSEARVLPRAGEVKVLAQDIALEFAQQAEAVMSRDDYPRHLKEFVRRYFLNLSAGTPREGAH